MFQPFLHLRIIEIAMTMINCVLCVSCCYTAQKGQTQIHHMSKTSEDDGLDDVQHCNRPLAVFLNGCLIYFIY